MEQILRANRGEWNIALLRSFWPSLISGHGKRSRSVEHEMTWLNLAGFSLRPGYGFVGDKERIAQLWPLYSSGMFHRKEKRCLEQWWIMWRRVAGGLSAEQQLALFDSESKHLKQKELETKELIRLIASLERLPVDKKCELAGQLLSEIESKRKFSPHITWALSRLGSRTLLYGEAEYLIPTDVIANWFKQLQELDWGTDDTQSIAAMFIQVGRMTGETSCDLPEQLRQQIIDKLTSAGRNQEEIRYLREPHRLKAQEQETLFGEKLPTGLYL